MGKRTIETNQAPQAIGPYSQALVCDGMVYTSGQIGLNPHSGELAGDDVETQARQVMANLEAVLGEAGSFFGEVIKSTIYLTDLKDFAIVNEIYAEFFPETKPARSTVQVAALPLGAKVEIDMIATLPDSSGAL
ncbi:RidA/YER057c/UK114 superfamily protein [hydrothermal vent metagenome]|uniref:RidA/YER057c/UK114 superfamily protein n=1 Tax=hydrothermal vent metagenome TaxID=652676 RepID=A0A3B1BNK4_9ZZZZ